MNLEDIFKKHQDFYLFLFFFVIALILRVYNLSGVSPYPDESIYLINSLKIIINDWAWPIEIMSYQPPLFPYLQALMITYHGSDLAILRIISAVAGSLTAGFMYLAGKSFCGTRAGIICAFFLSFLGFHVLYSRINQLEAITLMFIVMALFFFWEGYSKQKGIAYMIAAGISAGLAIDSKYISLFLLLGIFIFLILQKRSMKDILNLNIHVFYLMTFLIFLPVLVALYMNGINIISSNFASRFVFVNTPEFFLPTGRLSPIELAARGYVNYVEMLSYGSYLVPWGELVQVASAILVASVFIYYLLNFKKLSDVESFLLILFICSIVPILFLYRFQYYFLYALIIFIFMISGITQYSLRKLRQYPNKKEIIIVGGFIIALMLFIFSIFWIGLSVSSSYSMGDFDGSTIALSYIERHQDEIPVYMIEGTQNNYPFGAVFLTNTDVASMYISTQKLKNLGWGKNLFPVGLVNETENRGVKYISLDLSLLDDWMPEFVIISRTNYESYFNREDLKRFDSSYDFVFSSEFLNPNADEYLVFQRRNSTQVFIDDYYQTKRD